MEAASIATDPDRQHSGEDEDAEFDNKVLESSAEPPTLYGTCTNQQMSDGSCCRPAAAACKYVVSADESRAWLEGFTPLLWISS